MKKLKGKAKVRRDPGRGKRRRSTRHRPKDAGLLASLNSDPMRSYLARVLPWESVSREFPSMHIVAAPDGGPLYVVHDPCAKPNATIGCSYAADLEVDLKRYGKLTDDDVRRFVGFARQYEEALLDDESEEQGSGALH